MVLEMNNIFHLVSRAATLSTIPMTRFELNDIDVIRCYLYTFSVFCNGGIVITHSPTTSEVGGSNSNLMWESWSLLIDCPQFTVQNFDQLYVLVFFAHKTTHPDLTCTVLKAT